MSENTSALKPYGVWVVIAPFNFPFALAGGPAGAALVAGNTVVFKAASATPWSGRLLADALRDAGVPDGVFNFVTGPGRIDRRSADPPSRGRRHHVHRQLRRRHAPLPHVRRRPLAASVHRRDGRQERRDRVAAGEPGRRRHRRAALGVRTVGAEVFRLFARVRRARGVRRLRVRVARPRGEGVGRRSDAARALDGTGDRHRRGGALRGRRGADRRARGRRRAGARRRAARPWRSRARSLLCAGHRARAARASAVAHRALRAVRAGGAGRQRRRRHRAWPMPATTD